MPGASPWASPACAPPGHDPPRAPPGPAPAGPASGTDMPRLRPPPPTRLMLWTAFWVFLIDQASKWFVVHWLDLRTRLEIDVWPPFLNLRMAWNRGVNFGLF